MKITKDDFNKYEKVRKSGRTNMFDVRTVQALSGLRREKIIKIMKDYENLDQKYSNTTKLKKVMK